MLLWEVPTSSTMSCTLTSLPPSVQRIFRRNGWAMAFIDRDARSISSSRAIRALRLLSSIASPTRRSCFKKDCAGHNSATQQLARFIDPPLLDIEVIAHDLAPPRQAHGQPATIIKSMADETALLPCLAVPGLGTVFFTRSEMRPPQNERSPLPCSPCGRTRRPSPLGIATSSRTSVNDLTLSLRDPGFVPLSGNGLNRKRGPE